MVSKLRRLIGLVLGLFALGALGVLALALWFGHERSTGSNGFWIAGIVAGFGISGLAAAVWLYFDTHVARPLQKLAADLRVKADGGASSRLDAGSLKHLGDLGKAAIALSARLDDQTSLTADRVASETARLRSEREMLVRVLSGVPLAVVIVGPDHRITLYDGQAAEVLEPLRPLCLGQSVFAHLDEGQLTRALAQLAPDEMSPLRLATSDGTRVFETTLRRFGSDGGYMLSLECAPDIRTERPLAFDVETFAQPIGDALQAASMDELAYVIFDTETTGLLPDKDEVVQIGAVRALGRRLVEGESFETLVNPGRRIPRTSTEVHGISDAMVADAPPMRKAGTRFLQFAEGAVLVAHNAPFDMAFLRRHAEETGTDLHHPILDTVLLGAELFGATEALTLDVLAERLGVHIEEEERHTALGDARATATVFLRMLDVFHSRKCKTLGDLIALQARHTQLLPDLNRKHAPGSES